MPCYWTVVARARSRGNRLFRVKTSELGPYTNHNYPLKPSKTHQIFSSYCGVYSFFLFGLVLEVPDIFLTVPRFVALVLLYWVVLEIYREREACQKMTNYRLQFAAKNLARS